MSMENTTDYQGTPYHRLHEALPLGEVPPRVYAEIDTEALKQNYIALTKRVQAAARKPVRPIAVIKADAYGHSVALCAPALVEAGCRAFAVACVEEAIALRRLLERQADAADSLILILGYTDPACAPQLAALRLTAALVSEEHAMQMSEAAVAAGVQVAAHIALDTGMNRIGLAAHTDSEVQTAVRQAAAIMTLPGLCVSGLFSHFAEADGDPTVELTDGSRTTEQYERFAAVRDALEARGMRPALCHICNSAAAVRFPTTCPERLPDAVRLGIELYGYGVPVPDVTLRPVMRLCTSVVHLHPLLPGERVGYGGTYVAATPRLLATLPVGYADGWLRALSGASVGVCTSSGRLTAPVVGRICMDLCMIDVTGLPVALGDPIILFGEEPNELEALSSRAGTIPYELLCLVSARVPRVERNGAPGAQA